MKIRQATPDDAPAVCDVLVSVGGSIPWQTAQECRRHIEWMLALGALPVVAEERGVVIAEMELWWGPDVPELGTTMDITMLNVRADRQSRGVGGFLVEHALERARDKSCDWCCVWSDPHAIGFYRKQGFADRLQLCTFRLAPPEAAKPGDWRAEPATLRVLPEPSGRDMQTQRLLHPRLQWHVLVDGERDPPDWRGGDGGPAPPTARLVRLPGSDQPFLAVFRPAYWTGDQGRAELYVWSKDRSRHVLAAAIGEAADMGVTGLHTCAYGSVADMLVEMRADVVDVQHVLVRPPAPRPTSR